MSGEAGLAAEEAETVSCYRCGADVSPDARVCPECGRRQFRLCFCGDEIRRSVARCPRCGTDWSKIQRRRHRRSRESFRWRQLARYGSFGAGLALAVSLFAMWTYQGLEGRAVAYYGGASHASPSPGLVLSYLGAKASRLVEGIGDGAPAVGHAFAICLVGALAGAFVYLWRTELPGRLRPRRSRRTRPSGS
jgi:ribosomal protein L40E